MLGDDAFASLVSDEVKNKATVEQIEHLRLPENRARWKITLALLVEELDRQIRDLEYRRSEEVARLSGIGKEGSLLLLETQSRYEAKKSKISRFRLHVEKKLRILDLEDRVIDPCKEWREAVVTHKAKTLLASEATGADLELWSMLDQPK